MFITYAIIEQTNYFVWFENAKSRQFLPQVNTFFFAYNLKIISPNRNIKLKYWFSNC